jgi:L-ascorbate metabolism protein UlaG (beta-lactamase superfamily)
MKKWLVRIIGGLLLTILVVLTVAFVLEKTDKAVIVNYVRNENLKTIMPDWRGVPVDEKGRFVNAEFVFLPKTLDLLRWQLSGNPQKDEKANDRVRLEIKDPTEFLNGETDGILWLGHASFYIRTSGKTVLIDPVFGDPSFIKKFVEVPNPIEKIKTVDYVLLSHDHRDHCDEATIRQVAAKFPNAKFLAGLRMEELLRDWVTPTNEIQTAGWFQQFNLPDETAKITFLPVRHWCRRGLFDFNHKLWGGYVIEGGGKTVYFGGDSGFGSHYKETAEVFPQIDYFLIGIGAYSPRWFMEPNHNSPSDAAQAFIDSKAKILVPMHYGTFDLSDEPPNEPLKLLNEQARKRNFSDKVQAMTIYESILFESSEQRR